MNRRPYLQIISSSRFLQRPYVSYVIMHVVVLLQCPGRTLVQDANITSGPPSLTYIISAFLPFSFIGPFMRWAFIAHLTKMNLSQSQGQSHQPNIPRKSDRGRRIADISYSYPLLQGKDKEKCTQSVYPKKKEK